LNALASIPEDQETIVRSPFTLAAVASTVALLAGGCGGSSYSGGTSAGSSAKSTSASSNSPYGETQGTSAAASTTGSTSTPASTGVLIVSKHSHDGTILAAGTKRLTVYLFEGDHGSTSTCSGACAQVWPPVTTAAAATASGAAVTADLGTIKRADGTTQVTYMGHPLYFYAKDKDNGDAYGQNVNSFGADWYVLKPSGDKVDAS
jgi:predicted lipoprotein with Yx(FWY)xxD motif